MNTPIPAVPSDGPTKGWLPTGIFWREGRFYRWNKRGRYWKVWNGRRWRRLRPQPELLT